MDSHRTRTLLIYAWNRLKIPGYTLLPLLDSKSISLTWKYLSYHTKIRKSRDFFSCLCSILKFWCKVSKSLPLLIFRSSRFFPVPIPKKRFYTLSNVLYFLHWKYTIDTKWRHYFHKCPRDVIIEQFRMRPLRVLCIHGYRQSGEQYRRVKKS